MYFEERGEVAGGCRKLHMGIFMFQAASII
jgi:hypothetical protein